LSIGYITRPNADWDIDDIANELADRAQLELAIRFLATANETFDLIASHPKMGWPCRIPNLRLKAVRVFRVGEPFDKYLIFYQPLEDGIEILRVLHGSLDLERRLSIEGAL